EGNRENNSPYCWLLSVFTQPRAARAVPHAKLNDRERVGRRHSDCGVTQKREAAFDYTRVHQSAGDRKPSIMSLRDSQTIAAGSTTAPMISPPLPSIPDFPRVGRRASEKSTEPASAEPRPISATRLPASGRYPSVYPG